jgi:hypothetical protein
LKKKDFVAFARTTEGWENYEKKSSFELHIILLNLIHFYSTEANVSLLPHIYLMHTPFNKYFSCFTLFFFYLVLLCSYSFCIGNACSRGCFLHFTRFFFFSIHSAVTIRLVHKNQLEKKKVISSSFFKCEWNESEGV